MSNQNKYITIFLGLALVVSATYIWFKNPYESAKSGNLFIVQQHLWRYDDVNGSQYHGGLGSGSRTNNDITLLHYAAMGGQVHIMEYLLKNGANIDAKTDVRLMTPLHYAANEHKEAAVRFLIEQGANVNSRNNRDEPPLFFAIDQRPVSGMNNRYRIGTPRARERTINYLLENGADLKITDKWGKTSLMAAANRRDLPLMKRLVSLGVDVNARKTGLAPNKTALDYLLGSNTWDEQKATLEPIIQNWLISIMTKSDDQKSD